MTQTERLKLPKNANLLVIRTVYGDDDDPYYEEDRDKRDSLAKCCFQKLINLKKSLNFHSLGIASKGLKSFQMHEKTCNYMEIFAICSALVCCLLMYD